MDISLGKPVVSEETRLEVDRVLREEYFLRGESVTEFETEFAEYIGTKHAVAVDSGTRALHLSLQSLGISEGDTVVTTPATFIATANAIVQTGAHLSFVDVDPNTFTMNLDELSRYLEGSPGVDAILPIHLYGYPVEMDRLRDLAGDIPIVSDACQAHGANYQGEKVGSRADAGAFSFYPSKNMMVAGDGGMIVTDKDKLARIARSFRDVGRSQDDPEYERIGSTARMGTVNAAIGKMQLRKLDTWNDRRSELAELYTSGLSGIDGLGLPPQGDAEIDPAWYLYVVRTPQRDKLAYFLEQEGIETGVHYSIPVHQQPPYRDCGFGERNYPISEQWASEVLSLPMHPHLSNQEVEYVIECVKKYFDKR